MIVWKGRLSQSTVDGGRALFTLYVGYFLASKHVTCDAMKPAPPVIRIDMDMFSTLYLRSVRLRRGTSLCAVLNPTASAAPGVEFAVLGRLRAP